MDFVAVAIVFAIVFGHSSNKSRHLIGLNCGLLCFENSSQTTKILHNLRAELKGKCVIISTNNVYEGNIGNLRPRKYYETSQTECLVANLNIFKTTQAICIQRYRSVEKKNTRFCMQFLVRYTFIFGFHEANFDQENGQF